MRRFAYISAIFVVALFAIVSTYNGSLAQLKAFQKGTPEEIKLAESLSLNHLEKNLSTYGISSIKDLKVNRVFVDDLSMAHTRVQQTFEGVPVFGGEAIVHLNSDGSLSTVTDTLVKNVKVNAEPTLLGDEAINIATTEYGCSDCLTAAPEVDLWVLRHKKKDRLVYRVQLRREDGSHETAMPVYFIDAHNGEMVFNYNNLQTTTATGSGSSLYSGTVNITTSLFNSSYYMEDLGRKIGTFDSRNTTSSVFRFTDTDNVWNTTSQRAAVDVHFGASKVYDYYKNTHGRTGLNGSGGPGYYAAAENSAVTLISSKVHYSSGYNNAFWNGQFMTYGDGDGSQFSPLVSLDICGHEMTHGVTQFTAGLAYTGESGALNESMSDVFGALIESYARGGVVDGNTWKVGEQCYTPANGTNDALRHMDNPHNADNFGFTTDDDPDHYSERYTGTGDNGGVHINSGIGNKAFYLVAVGGTHHLGGSMTGIGISAAGRIWYKALTTYMTSSTTFAEARTATTNAANDLYGSGSTQSIAVQQAWCMVGVGSCPSAPPPPPPPPSGNLLTNGGFEGSVSPWVASGAAGWVSTANSTGSYPHSGQSYIYLGNANSVTSSQVYQQFTIPSTATSANLNFYLNVGSSETTTTAQFDKLFVEVRNSAGSLLATLATYSNLNKATAGSYSLKGAFSLLAYKGQTVRVQFRATTDSSLSTIFRVDDVTVQ
jgi:Zn-dependent metalloprotease